MGRLEQLFTDHVIYSKADFSVAIAKRKKMHENKETQTNCDFFTKIPTELRYMIYSKLDEKSKTALSLSCKQVFDDTNNLSQMMANFQKINEGWRSHIDREMDKHIYNIIDKSYGEECIPSLQKVKSLASSFKAYAIFLLIHDFEDPVKVEINQFLQQMASVETTCDKLLSFKRELTTGQKENTKQDGKPERG